MKKEKSPRRFGAHLLVCCEGGYPEALLNELAAANIPVWDIRRKEISLYFRVFAADYRAIRPLSRRSHVRMRIKSKHGLVFWCRRVGFRGSLVVSLAVFAAVLALLSSRVWVLRIEGNHTVPDQAIRETLAPLGVQVGAPFSKVDLPSLRLTVLQELPSLTWLAVNQQGCILTVSVTERVETAPPVGTTPANILSACDGVIVNIDTRVGQSMVSVGDAVRQGDLLISGVADSRVGPQLKTAQGRVIARTTRTVTVSVPLRETIFVPARTVVQPSITVFGLTMPLYTNATLTGTPEKETKTHTLTAANVPLPIGVTVNRYHYTQASTRTRTESEARAEAARLLQEKEAVLYCTFNAEQRTVTEEIIADSITLTAIYIGTEDIGVSVPIV